MTHRVLLINLENSNSGVLLLLTIILINGFCHLIDYILFVICVIFEFFPKTGRKLREM